MDIIHFPPNKNYFEFMFFIQNKWIKFYSFLLDINVFLFFYITIKNIYIIINKR